MPRRTAFTLTELLVVTAILGVLAAILLPVVGMVRDAAQRAVCGSNQRQVAMAAFAYADEYDGFIPADHRLGKETADTSPAWFHRLPAYLDLADTGCDRTVFHCPSWRMPAKAAKPLSANYPRSFKQNDYLDRNPAQSQRDAQAPPSRHYRLGSVPDQGEVLLFADGDTGKDGTTGAGQWGYLQEGLLSMTRHRRLAVGTCLDGHVSSSGKADGFHWVSLTWLDP